VKQELIIRSAQKGVEIAFLEDKNLVEIHKEKKANNFTVGDIFLTKVKKTIPNLNASFLNVGYHKDAFLHYTDLGPNIRSLKKLIRICKNGSTGLQNLKDWRYEDEIVKTGKITEVLKKGDDMLVQVLKEPIAQKGPRLTSEIALAGRFMVLIPFSNAIAVSRKISSADERKRLKRLAESLKPDNFGLVIRTVAENQKSKELHEDMHALIERWNNIFDNLKNAKNPEKVYQEVNKTTGILRDLLNANFSGVTVDDKDLYYEIKNYVESIAPDKAKIVNHYSGKAPIFDHYGITKQIKSSFGKTASLASGVYLIIEHTEAMHVIDINSGNKVSKEDSQEENAYKVNLEAAKEVARQLRLRDLGGLIMIDFIDMKLPDNKKKLNAAMNNFMKNDRARHTILPLSRFNIMQITRERTRPEVKIVTTEQCPSCQGTGKIGASILLVDDIENNIKYLLNDQNQSKLKLIVHPMLESHITKGLFSKRFQWFKKYGKWIKVTSDKNYPLTQYKFYDHKEEEIVI